MQIPVSQKVLPLLKVASEEDAKKAILDLNGSSFMERAIVVNEARPKAPREERDFWRSRKGGFDRGRGGAGGLVTAGAVEAAQDRVKRRR